MPITLAHPLAVVPLAKLGRFASFSGLVIGTLMPDVLGKATMSMQGPDQARAISHSFWPGVFPLSLIVGWAFWLFFQGVLKRPLAALLPAKVTAYTWALPRLGPLSRARGAQLLVQICVISVSLMLGATTHVVWDWFTHPGTPVTHLFPVLERKLFTGSGYTLYVYKIMQHGSGLLGMGLLAWLSWRWMQRQPDLPADFSPPLTIRERVGLLGSLVFASCLLGVVAGLESAWGGQWNLGWVRNFAGPAVWTTLITCAMLLAIYALIWQAGMGQNLSRGENTGER